MVVSLGQGAPLAQGATLQNSNIRTQLWPEAGKRALHPSPPLRWPARLRIIISDKYLSIHLSVQN